ncbi:MAG TPA: M67 family metallopeptidase [Anaerolineales bacterium]|nr:M67 family metallopeptidase [Anaerolineales bacterium]
MILQLSEELLARIHDHGEQAYPEEGAGFLLGASTENGSREVTSIFPLINSREDEARHNRYLITPEDYLKAELEADRLGLSLIGVFHSHPDHPNRPSEYDREWAQPFFSYVITSVHSGKAVESRSWRLAEDRSKFEEEEIKLGQ